MNRQLRSCLEWWLKLLHTHVPRAIPFSLMGLPVVVSYSDGEGSGGFGAALWHPALPRPRAAFLKVPRQIWSLRQLQKEWFGSEFTNIYEIEALGPMVVATMWPELLHGMLWIHFIDNDAALSSIVRGSSSVAAGDAIISWTWLSVMDLKAWLWIDRVASKSNPVDGLSRGRKDGPWKCVENAWIDPALIRELQQEVEALKADIYV